MKMDLPISVPGWGDGTPGNMYAARCMAGHIKNVHTVRTGIEYLLRLADWYMCAAEKHAVGFFRRGGGIAGDFTICVVPMSREDFREGEISLWGYYCQISDSVTSYGPYSGASPDEGAVINAAKQKRRLSPHRKW